MVRTWITEKQKAESPEYRGKTAQNSTQYGLKALRRTLQFSKGLILLETQETQRFMFIGYNVTAAGWRVAGYDEKVEGISLDTFFDPQIYLGDTFTWMPDLHGYNIR